MKIREKKKLKLRENKQKMEKKENSLFFFTNGGRIFISIFFKLPNIL
jgi:hypothetical protein